MKQMLTQFIQLTKQAFIRHPIEIIWVSLTSLLMFDTNERFEQILDVYQNDLLLLPICLMIINLARKTKLYWPTLLLPVAAIALRHYAQWDKLLVDSRYWTLLICCVIWFLSEGWQRDNTRYVETAARKALNLVWASLIALAFGLAFSSLLLATDMLFNISLSGGITRVWFFTWVWVQSVSYLSLSQRREAFKLHSFGKLLLNWVLSPVLLVYTLVLYAYALQVLVFGEMPKGMVANVAFPYLSMGLVLQALHLLLENTHWRKFYRIFNWLALLPLVMLWYATWLRVDSYGLTEDRVYLIVGVVALTLCYLIQLIPVLKQYRYMALISIVALCVSTFGLNAEEIGRNAQLTRFQQLLVTNNLLTADNKIDRNALASWKKGLSEDQRKQFNSVLYYLSKDSDYAGKISEQYGVKDSLYGLVINNQKTLSEEREFELLSAESTHQYIDTTGYRQLLQSPINLYPGVSNSDYMLSKKDNCKKVGAITVTEGLYEEETMVSCEEAKKDLLITFKNVKDRPAVVWNTDEYIRELFKQKGLDSRTQYSTEKLREAFEGTPYRVQLPDAMIVFSEMGFKYVDGVGYRLKNAYVMNLLFK